MTLDHIATAKAALGASTSATDPLAIAFYLASARLALVRAREEIAAVEVVLVAREREAAYRSTKQLAMPDGGSNK
jgi:hypothetical protein